MKYGEIGPGDVAERRGLGLGGGSGERGEVRSCSSAIEDGFRVTARVLGEEVEVAGLGFGAGEGGEELREGESRGRSGGGEVGERSRHGTGVFWD